VHLLHAWVEATPPEDREALAIAIPLDALTAAAGTVDDVQLRREIVILLGQLADPTSMQRLLLAVPDPSPAVRREALRAIATRDPAAARTLLPNRLVVETHPTVRSEILGIWRRKPSIRPAEAAEIVGPLTVSKDIPVRVVAIGLMGDLAGRSSLETIRNALVFEDRDTRLATIDALGRLGSRAAGSLLSTIADPGDADPELSKRLASARARCE
jgi:HEAT repeat protein